MKIFDFLKDLGGKFSHKRIISLVASGVLLLFTVKGANSMLASQSYMEFLYLMGGLVVFVLFLTKIITVENISSILKTIKEK